jgi:hypothetical protein
MSRQSTQHQDVTTEDVDDDILTHLKNKMLRGPSTWRKLLMMVAPI